MQLSSISKDALQPPDADGRPSRPTNRDAQGKPPAAGVPTSALESSSRYSGLTHPPETVSQDGDRLPEVYERVQSPTSSMPGAADILSAGEAAEAAQWIVAQMREQPGTAILAQANLPAAAAWPLLEAI